MAMSESAIKQAMIQALQAVIKDVPRHTIRSSKGGIIESVGRDGSIENPVTGEKRYWLAAVIVSDREDLITQLKTILSQRSR